MALAANLVLVACGEGDVEITAGEQLGAAFAQTGETTTFRMTQSAGQTIILPELKLDTKTEIDPNRPTVVGEVSPEASHLTIDLGSLLGPMLGVSPDELDVQIAMWSTTDSIVIDTTTFENIVGADPAQLGPYRPGVALVDLNELEADAPDLVAALTGSSVFDLGELAVRLPAVLTNLEQVSDDPVRFTGTASFADLAEAQGADIEQIARAAVAGIAVSMTVDVDILTEAYIEGYRELMTDVAIELSPEGLVQEVTTRADLVPMIVGLFDEDNAAALDLSPGEVSATAEALADATWIMESRMTFEPDPNLVVEAPPPATEDRTAEYRDFLTAAGF